MYQCLFFSLGTYLYILRILEVNGRTDVRVTTEPSSIFTRTRSDKKLIMAAISGMQGAQSIICNFDRVKKDKSNEEIKKNRQTLTSIPTQKRFVKRTAFPSHHCYFVLLSLGGGRTFFVP